VGRFWKDLKGINIYKVHAILEMCAHSEAESAESAESAERQLIRNVGLSGLV
jgi:hypothetical protein